VYPSRKCIRVRVGIRNANLFRGRRRRTGNNIRRRDNY
jgi:hypothetical protein